MFLLIDNYDSFTYNLVQAFQQLGAAPVVLKNDDDEVLELATSGRLERVCLSPGPSKPLNAGHCLEFLNRVSATIPILGVCLGHQCLGHFAGATVERNERIMHGKTSDIHHNNEGLFEGAPQPMEVCRYHSLVVRAHEAPDLLEVTSTTTEDEVMGIRYKDRPWHGLQFHPESILTPDGPHLLSNFLNMKGA